MQVRCGQVAYAALTALAFLLPASANAAPPADCDRCFALVRPDGSLIRQRNVQANYKPSPGLYEILFKYPVNKCTFYTQVEGRTGLANVYRISTLGNPVNRTVSISPANVDGSGIDATFSIYVLC